MYNKYLPYQYYRSKNHLTPPKPIIPPSPPPAASRFPCQPTNPPKPQKKIIDFKSFKKNTCTSLNDVECFLNNFCSTLKYIKLINLLK